MRSLLFVLIFLLSISAVKAQQNLDSLHAVWQDETQTDSIRSKAYGDYIRYGFLFTNPDSAFTLAQELLQFGEEQPYDLAQSAAYHLIGIYYAVKSDYPKALDNMRRSSAIDEELGEKIRLAKTISNIGSVYRKLGDENEALSNYQSSLKISQELKDDRGSAFNITSIGVIYADQGDYTKALEYFRRSLKIHEEMEDQLSIANVLGNIGEVYQKQGDNTKALDYIQRGLMINENLGNRDGSANSFNRLGIIYSDENENALALEYFQQSLKIFDEMGSKVSSANCLSNIGTIYHDQKAYNKALEYCKKALVISKEFSALEEEKSACRCLFDTYKALGNGNEALVYMEKINAIDESLNTQETTKKLQQMEFAKQVLADSIATAEEARLVDEAHKEEVQKKNKTRNLLAGGGLIVLLIAGGVYSRLRYVRKSKAIIEEEKDRSNNLLLNILPADIAEELKIHGKAEARDFDMVSILFTDFKGFTEASAKLSAADLVSEINHCFEAFDHIMGKYKIEKIKTIGDAYMAAGGLPVPTDDSIKNTVLAALEMQAFIGKRKAEMDTQNKPAFEMRVGIHTGPVVAGIVGVKKFQYDIWGDTVNTASRMESSGAVGKVNVSQTTYDLLKDDTEFNFQSRGKVVAKGKGEMEMYFVSRS